MVGDFMSYSMLPKLVTICPGTLCPGTVWSGNLCPRLKLGLLDRDSQYIHGKMQVAKHSMHNHVFFKRQSPTYNHLFLTKRLCLGHFFLHFVNGF